MQHERRGRERKEQEQVVHWYRLRLKNGLHKGDIDEGELRQERDCDGDQQHPVLSDPAADPAVLNRRNEIEENEAGERLRGTV